MIYYINRSFVVAIFSKIGLIGTNLTPAPTLHLNKNNMWNDYVIVRLAIKHRVSEESKRNRVHLRGGTSSVVFVE